MEKLEFICIFICLSGIIFSYVLIISFAIIFYLFYSVNHDACSPDVT